MLRGVYFRLVLVQAGELNARLQLQFVMGCLLEDVLGLSLAEKGSVSYAPRSVRDRSQAIARRTVRRFASGVHR